MRFRKLRRKWRRRGQDVYRWLRWQLDSELECVGGPLDGQWLAHPAARWTPYYKLEWVPFAYYAESGRLLWKPIHPVLTLPHEFWSNDK